MIFLSEKYTVTILQDSSILSIPINQSVDEIISITPIVFSSKGLGIQPNSNNMLNNYAVAIKDYEIILQCGENAINIHGMIVSITVLYSE